MKILQLISITLICLQSMGTLAQPKAPDIRIEPKNFVCQYGVTGGTCTVQLVDCINQKQCRIEFDGHWLKVSAAYQSMATISEFAASGFEKSDSKNVSVPMSPQLESDLEFISVEITNVVGNGTPKLEKFDSEKSTFKKCQPTIQAGAKSVTVLKSKPMMAKKVLLSSKKDCELAVLAVTLSLPPGAKVPSDLLQNAMRNAGQEMERVLQKTSADLAHLSDALPSKRKALANSYAVAVEDLRKVLRGSITPDGQYVNHFQVMEAARNLFVHASVLEAILNKNKNPLTEKYITAVTAVLAQIVPAFGFNDRSMSTKVESPMKVESPIPTGPLSTGYIALMTGLDVVLQDVIVGLPLASNSAELASLYDLQSFVQKIKANTSRTDNELLPAISRLQAQWNDSPFQNVLKALKQQVSEPSGQSSTVCSNVKRHPILKILVSIAESLQNFSDEEFDLPFKMDCE